MNTLKKQTLVNKGLSAERLLCRTWLYPANQPKPRAAKYCPITVALGQCYGKYCYALPVLKASIVLPDFGRSWSADGGNENFILRNNISDRHGDR